MIRYNEEKKANEICVIEIFQSLNGEGPLAGFPTMFIRVMGCNLRCKYGTIMRDNKDSILNGFCDTPECFSEKHFKETYPDRELSWLTAKEIYETVVVLEKYWLNKSICLTGGEPLTEDNKDFMLNELLPLFLEGDVPFDVSIETNGSIDYTDYKKRFAAAKVYPDGHRVGLSLITDWKFPKSGMVNLMADSNLKILGSQDVIKIVMSDAQEDWNYLGIFLEKINSAPRSEPDNYPAIYLSPMFGYSNMSRLWKFVTDHETFRKNDKVPIRMQVQLHKIVFADDPNKKGV